MPLARTPLLATLAVTLAMTAGCYDGKKLVDRAHSKAIKSRLEEVDLGEFRVTLPLDVETGETTFVSIHPFASTPHYRLKAIKKQLKKDQAVLQHHTLIAMRAATPEELAEPKLNTLRSRLLKSVNDVLKDAPIQEIGFYDVRFIRQ